ncbi:MAG: hypothetical protein F6K47_38255 [Symploca sp. SIO2E6]|nr:hypothetical protein [Symploca sp. SIO2E6]
MGNDLPVHEKNTPIFPLSVLGKSIDIQEFQPLLSPRQVFFCDCLQHPVSDRSGIKLDLMQISLSDLKSSSACAIAHPPVQA